LSQTLVLIHYPVVALCEAQAFACAGRNERGGILIGSLRGPHVEILDFTEAGPDDSSQPFRFIRQDPKHQRAATRAWRESDERKTFLGEWHTHPSGEPRPSSIDTASWRKLARRQNTPMVFIVVAPGKWLPYFVRPGFFRTRVDVLDEIEKGAEGVVFRVRPARA
jgi:integrative and conjugative element protein (TIGR02256 family)